MARNNEPMKWLTAMTEEFESLQKNQTQVLVERKPNQKVVSCKWIFKWKQGATENEPIRFKARLVARGYTPREGIDYIKVFSPVVKHTLIRVLMSIVAQFDWELEQQNVKTTFLHGDLEEKILMTQPEGFEKSKKKHLGCLLKKKILIRIETIPKTMV